MWRSEDTLQESGLKLLLSASVASIVIHWAILPALTDFNVIIKI